MTSNSALQSRHGAAVPRGVGTAHPIYCARALNAEIWDVEGRRYIDFASGIAVTNTGHCHPRVTAAVKAQIDLFTHPCFQVVGYETYVRLAERLNRLAPGASAKKTIFFSTGAEAVENAVKIARSHTGRPGVVAFSGGFHGRTLMTLALTGKLLPYKAGFGPFPADVHHVPFPVPLHGIGEEQSLEALDRLFHADIEPGRVAAIIIEPVQGEGGFYAASPAFLQALRGICDQHRILLIADEVQTGFGRTGRMFAVEHAGVEPDLVTVAKALAGGFPLSGVIGKAEIMDAPGKGGLGGTYGGSPVACAAAHAVLDIIEEEGLLARADAIGARIAGWAERRARRSVNRIAETRVIGAMAAIELTDGDAVPAAELTRRIGAAALAEGLITLSCGVRANVIRFLPPLTIGDATLEEGLAILDRVMDRIS